MAIFATTVTQEFRVHKRNYRILFGAAEKVLKLDEARSVAVFSPGSIIGLDLWDSNLYGTTQWRVLVCQTVAPGEVAQRIPQVAAGDRILLDVRGATRARAALRWLASHVDGQNLNDISAERFALASLRLNRMPLTRLKRYIEELQ